MLLLLLTAPLRAALVLPTTDAFGYGADSVPYTWTEISGTGTLVSAWTPSVDDGSVLLDLPFNFRFYGADYNKVAVSSNGYLQFGVQSSFFGTNCLGANQDPRQIAALYWMDLDPSLGGAVYFQVLGSPGSRVAVIQFQAVPPSVGGGVLTAQARLYEGSHRIEMAWATASAGGNGAAAVAGLRSGFDCPNRTSLPLSCQQAVLADGLAVRFDYPGTEPACGTPTVSPTFSFSPTASPSATITETHTISPTFSISPTVTPSFSASPSFSVSPTPVDTATVSPSPSASPSPSPSATPLVLTDAFGYIAVQAPLAWEDISSSGQPVTAWAGGPDDGSVLIDLPSGWLFRFYGADYSKVGISSNGYLQFGTSSSAFGHNCLGAATSPFGLAALFWMDLDPGAGGDVRWQVLGSPGSRRLVVQFTGVPDDAASGTLTAQAVLFEGSHGLSFRYLSSTGLGSGNAASAGLRSLFDCPNRTGLSLSCDLPGLGSGTQFNVSYPALEPACGTPTPTPSPSATPSQTVTLSASPTSSATPTITETATESPSYTISPTFTDSPTITETHTISPTFSVSPTITETATESPSFTVSATFTDSPTITETATISPTFTDSPTITETHTISPTFTVSPTVTDSPTISPSFTESPTFSVSPTMTPTFTASPTTVPTLVPSPCVVWSLNSAQLPMSRVTRAEPFNGGIAIVGEVLPGPDYFTASDSAAAFVDLGGTVRWARQFDRGPNDILVSAAADGGGGLLTGGGAQGSSVLRLDALGNSTYSYTRVTASVGAFVSAAPGGGAYMVGMDRVPGGLPFGIASEDVHVTALSAGGTEQWSVLINDATYDRSFRPASTAGGLLYVSAIHAAWLTGTASGSVRQYSSGGALNWTYPLTSGYQNYVVAISVTGSSAVIVTRLKATSSSATTYQALVLNAAGSVTTTVPLPFDGARYIASVEQSADGSYLLAGWLDASTVFGARVSASGVKLWQRNYTAPSIDDPIPLHPRVFSAGANRIVFSFTAIDQLTAPMNITNILELWAEDCVMPTSTPTTTLTRTPTPTRTATSTRTVSPTSTATLFPPATKPACLVLGQPNYLSSSSGSGTALAMNSPGGIAMDTRLTPFKVYVADTANHRILVWNDASGLNQGQPADGVIGQADFSGATANRGGGTQADSLNTPLALAVDPFNGDLWVADSGNHRVLRFSAPIAVSGAAADRVLGQGGSFSSGVPSLGGTSAASLNTPSALSFDGLGRLAVADSGHHRVLRFSTPGSVASADAVWGQNFSLSSGLPDLGGGVDSDGLNSPLGVHLGPTEIWIADTGNHRVLRFSTAPVLSATANLVLGQPNFTANTANQGFGLTNETRLHTPMGLGMDGAGRLMVADSGNHRVLAFEPVYDNFAEQVWGQPNIGSRIPGTGQDQMQGPRALSAWSALLAVADSGNHRALIYGCSSGLQASTPTPSATPSATRSVTATISPTHTDSPTVSPTFTPSESFTRTASRTLTATRTETLTPGPSFTITETHTETPTQTVTPTPSITLTLSVTETRPPTQTPYPRSNGNIIAWPNPAPLSGGRVCVGFPAAGDVRVEVYDRLAQPVAAFSELNPAAGYACWDLRNRQGTAVGPGMYFVRVLADGQVRVGKLTLR